MSDFKGYAYEEMEVGMFHETVHTIRVEDIDKFAEVSGDYNPLHMDNDYAATTQFGQRIAHGALTASFISAILGNNLPGPGCIFVGLSMRFRRPIFIGSEVTVRAEVAEKIDRGNRVTLTVSCSVNGKKAISGEAQVVAPSRTPA